MTNDELVLYAPEEIDPQWYIIEQEQADLQAKRAPRFAKLFAEIVDWELGVSDDIEAALTSVREEITTAYDKAALKHRATYASEMRELNSKSKKRK